jgi:hypothetical protein
VLTSAASGAPSSFASRERPLRLWWQGTPLPNSEFQIVLHETPSGDPTISRSLPLRALQGLRSDQFSGASPAAIAFHYNVEAGELSCVGHAALGRGAGECEFYPSISYADALARLGVAPHDDLEQLRLGMAQVTVEYVRAMLKSGLHDPDAEDLKRLRNHGIGAADVSAAPDKTADAIIHAQKKHRGLETSARWTRPTKG